MTGRQIVILVVENEDRSRGEFTHFGDVESAQRKLEQLLVDGVEEDRICIFEGQSLSWRISY